MRNKVLLLVLAFSLVVGATLVAAAQEAQLPDWTKGVKELTWWNAGALKWDPAIVETARAFESKYGIKVNLAGIPETNYVSDAARTLATGDTTYDVYDMLIGPTMPTWAERGWIAPIDEAVTPLMASKWPEKVWSAAEYNGKHYFVPHMGQPLGLYWNKKLFEKAGLNPDKGPKSWDELVEIAQKLTQDTDGDGRIDQWGFVFPLGKLERTPILGFAYFLGMNGGRLWNEDGSPAFEGKKGEEALQFMVDLVNKYKVTPVSVINYDSGSVGDIFAEGSAGMVMHFFGHPLVKDAEDLGRDNLGGSMPPASRAGVEATYPLGFVDLGAMVNVNSKHLEAAKHLAAFYGTYEASWRETVFETNGGYNMDIWDSPRVREAIIFPDAIAEGFAKGYAATHEGQMVAMDVFKEGLHNAMNQKLTPREALDWIMKELKARNVL